MKTTITVALIALIGLTTASCSREKEWTCMCTLKSTGIEGAYGTMKAKKDEAKTLCEEGDDSPTSPYSDCHIK